MKLPKEVEVSKEMYELMAALKGIVKSVKEGQAAGKSAIEIAMLAASQNVVAIMAAMDGVDKLSDEAKSEKAAFQMAAAVGSAEIMAEIGV